jgi:hypothetical protein
MPPRCCCGLDPAASSLPPSSISWATPESPKPDVQTRSVAHRLFATSDASDVAAAMAFRLHRETSQELVFTPVSAMPPMSSRAHRADRHGPDSPVPLKIRQLKDCIAQYHCGRGNWCGMPTTAWDDDELYDIVCRLMQSLTVLRAQCGIPAAESLQLPPSTAEGPVPRFFFNMCDGVSSPHDTLQLPNEHGRGVPVRSLEHRASSPAASESARLFRPPTPASIGR